MTAEEIRKTLYDTGACTTQDAQIIVNALAEIAAQLAELNAHLTLFSVGNDPDTYRSLAVTLVEAEKPEVGAA